MIELIPRVVNYLREINALEGKPVFEKTATRLVCVDPRGQWDEYYMTHPFWQPRTTEFHKAEFESIDSMLDRIGLENAQERALEEIPDSESTVIIELGSGHGTLGAGYLASQKPNSRVMLISKPWEEEGIADWLFYDSGKGMKYRLIFKKGKELLHEKDLQKRINGLYKANGINNVRFYEHELTIEEINGTLPNFLRDFNGKDIYILGYKSPGRLPFLMGLLYNKLNAKQMRVSLTSIEKIRPEHFPWEIIQKNLELTDDELQGYIDSTHDPIATESKDTISIKYDYANPAQTRVAVMLKLGIALALAKEVNGKVLRDNCKFTYTSYNQQDHYVEASR
jgi:hypothetical protein